MRHHWDGIRERDVSATAATTVTTAITPSRTYGKRDKRPVLPTRKRSPHKNLTVDGALQPGDFVEITAKHNVNAKDDDGGIGLILEWTNPQLQTHVNVQYSKSAKGGGSGENIKMNIDINRCKRHMGFEAVAGSNITSTLRPLKKRKKKSVVNDFRNVKRRLLSSPEELLQKFKNKAKQGWKRNAMGSNSIVLDYDAIHGIDRRIIDKETRKYDEALCHAYGCTIKNLNRTILNARNRINGNKVMREKGCIIDNQHLAAKYWTAETAYCWKTRHEQKIGEEAPTEKQLRKNFRSLPEQQHSKYQRVAVFVDVQNMFYSAKHLHNAKLNFSKLMEKVVRGRQLIRAVSYVVNNKDIDQSSFIEMLESNGYEIKSKELRMRADGSSKADWDMGMAIDAISIVDKIDIVVLVSGDGDFIDLVKYLQYHGVSVEANSFIKSTNEDLIEAVNHYIPIEEDLLIKPKFRFKRKKNNE